MRVKWAGAALYAFEQGKIADLWVLGDVHGIFE
jgi:predicted ester cyclase